MSRNSSHNIQQFAKFEIWVCYEWMKFTIIRNNVIRLSSVNFKIHIRLGADSCCMISLVHQQMRLILLRGYSCHNFFIENLVNDDLRLFATYLYHTWTFSVLWSTLTIATVFPWFWMDFWWWPLGQIPNTNCMSGEPHISRPMVTWM